MIPARRFWQEVAIKKIAAKENAAKNAAGGFAITLDGRDIRTPSGGAFVVPTQALANAVCDEWDKQDKICEPATMPMFQFAVTVIDRVIPQRGAVIDEIVRYGSTDLLCYREAQNQILKQHQDVTWQPYLDWAASAHGIELAIGYGVIPQLQSKTALGCAHKVVAAHSDYHLAGLHALVSLSGSLVLGLAVADGFVSAGDVFQAAFLDELWQQEKWGYDKDADDSIKNRQHGLVEAQQYLGLLNKDEE